VYVLSFQMNYVVLNKTLVKLACIFIDCINHVFIMKQNYVAIFLALVTATMSLAGCFGSEETSGVNDEQGDSLNEWQVHLAMSESDLPNCNSERQGWLYFIRSEENFRTCTNSGWDVVDIVGEDGINSLIRTSIETSNANCAEGGIEFSTGLDENRNGLLDEEEIKQQQFICGLNNSQSNTQSIVLTDLSLPPAALMCDAGGRVISYGYDDGDGGGVSANGILETGEVDSSVTYCSRFTTGLVADISTNPGISHLTVAGNKMYFSGNGGMYGSELWMSDGTKNGTKIVKDIAPGIDSSSPTNILQFGNSIVFLASEARNDPPKLWISEGTSDTTTKLSESFVISDLVKIGNTVFFASRGVDDVDLWMTDGTVNGTEVVKRGGFRAFLESPLGNNVFFLAYDSSHGVEYWKSDGTSQGTRILKDINPGVSGQTSSELTYTSPENEFGLHGKLESGYSNGLLYFFADDGQNGIEPWISDGTEAGTKMLMNIDNSQGHGAGNCYIGPSVGNFQYFTANDGINSRELWITDGTTSGTSLIDVWPNGGSDPRSLTLVGTDLYFITGYGNDGFELWKTDGTQTGSSHIYSFNNSDGGHNSFRPNSLTVFGNSIYFVAHDSRFGYELWSSDGTNQGTLMDKEVSIGPRSTSPSHLTVFENSLYFVGSDQNYGWALFSAHIVETEIIMTY